jgi:hypothetical protein
MDFSKYQPSKAQSGGSQKLGLSITNTDSGMRIRFSGELSAKLGITENDLLENGREIQFLFYENTMAIGFGILDDVKGFQIKGNLGRPMIYNSQLAKEILDVANISLQRNKTHTFTKIKFEKSDSKIKVAVVNLK